MELAGRPVGNREPLFVIAGPCVIESEALVIEVATAMRALTERLSMHFVFKASFDKANRSSSRSFRGPGMAEGLRVLAKVRAEVGVPVLTDVHEDTPIDEVADVVDVLQTPAFLVRQSSYMARVARAGKPMNVKKGQFQAPWDMQAVVDKCADAGNHQVMLCERGASFGYNNLVTDLRGIPVMRRTGCPVIFDATHSVQRPGALGDRSGGDRDMVPVLVRGAVAAGIAGLFLETHPRPDEALSDGPNSWPLARMEELLRTAQDLDRVVKAAPWLEDEMASLADEGKT